MQKFSSVSMLISVIFFIILMANVMLGALKLPVFLSDVMEMLVLLTSSIFFVATILAREWLAKLDH
jgi:hypothetical protein